MYRFEAHFLVHFANSLPLYCVDQLDYRTLLAAVDRSEIVAIIIRNVSGFDILIEI